MDNLFTTLRVLLILFSISVWHSFANEKMSAGTLEVGSCRLFNSDLFLTVFLALYFVFLIVIYEIFQNIPGLTNIF